MVQKLPKVLKVLLDQMEELERRVPLDQLAQLDLKALKVQLAQQAQLDLQDRQEQKDNPVVLENLVQKVQLDQVVLMV